MKHYAGLDVSVKETSICIVDEAGRICREMKVVSHPEDLLAVLCDPAWRLERVGLEAGPLSQWLFSGLAEAGVPAICIETRHAKAFLKAQVNKSDRNDARGIAQMMRVRLIPARARQDACKPETALWRRHDADRMIEKGRAPATSASGRERPASCRSTARTAPTQRDSHIRSINEHGRMNWQKTSGSNRRSKVEAAIAATSA